MIPIQQTTYYRRYSSQRISELATWLATRASQEVPLKERTQDTLVHELPARYSAQRRFSRIQIVVLLPLAFVLVPLFLLFRLEALRLAISLISGVYLLHLGFLFILTLLAGRKVQKGVALPLTTKQIGELAHEHWPHYSILVPLYRETAILPQLLRALKQIDYPQACLEILLLVEEDDYGMARTLSQADLSPVMRVVCVPQGYPRTKPRACNFGLAQATGDYLVIYDAEDIPDPLQLKRAVLTFAESHPRVACVQAQLNFYNAGANLLTRFFTLEYSLWFDLVLPGLVKLGAALPLGGTSNHFRTAVLRQLYGWDAYNVTEDADLGLRLSRYGFQTVVMEATTYEEATSQVGNWLGQRSRWIKGYIQTVLVQLRQPRKLLFSPKGLRQNGPTLGLVAGVSWFFLLNPLMWAMLLVYLVARTRVEDFYHAVFSPFALYAGVLCLFFGNLFFVVLAMCSAYRRRQYGLVPYALLLPFYWVLLSVAAARALYEFAVRPHHWQKTQHGLHLKGVQEFELADGSGQVEREFYFPANKGGPVELLTTTTRQRSYESLTSRVKAIGTMPVPIAPTKVSREQGQGRGHDPFLLITLLLALLLSIGATYYSFTRHFILIYGDGISHLLIARGVLDSATPGLGQLGGVWLPLPHILLSFVTWNDYLWKTGLAGSIVGGVCYLGTVVYIYLAIVRLTRKHYTGLLGSLVFLLNPNVLYLQSSPMTEPVCWVTFTAACYYLLAWVQEDSLKFLLLAAIATFFATLARYDGWILITLVPLILILVGRMKGHTFHRIKGNILLFLVLGVFGILLWFLWSKAIFNNAFYFQSGPYSSQQQTLGTATPSELAVRGHILQDTWLYSLDTIETLGIGLFLLSILSFFLFFWKRWRSPEAPILLLFLSPFIFYVVALFGGQVALLDGHTTLYLSGIIPKSESRYLFNARYGSEMVAPAAIFIGMLFAELGKWKRVVHGIPWRSMLGQALLLLVIMLQSGWIAYGGVISVIGNSNPPFCVGSYTIEVYLQERYTDGLILMTEYPFHLSVASSDIHFSQVIWEGSQALWEQALTHPIAMTWVIDAPGDIVDISLTKNDPQFSQQFTLVAMSDTGLRLYHRNTGLPLPLVRPLSDYLAGEQQFCTLSTYQK